MGTALHGRLLPHLFPHRASSGTQPRCRFGASVHPLPVGAPPDRLLIVREDARRRYLPNDEPLHFYRNSGILLL